MWSSCGQPDVGHPSSEAGPRSCPWQRRPLGVLLANRWIGAQQLVALGVALAAEANAEGQQPVQSPKAPFRVITVTVLAAAAICLGQSGVLFQLSGFLQGAQGYGPLASGVAFVPFGLATLIGSLAVGVAMERRFRRVGAVEVGWIRGLIFVGLLVAGISALAFGFLQPDTPDLPIGIALTGLGAGAAVANVPRTDLLFGAVRPSHRGTAAGFNGGAFILGEALGSSLVTVMLSVTVGGAGVARLGEAGVPAATAE